MKNFTNNFKQFTSRLSARWLIMALMMLVGTSSAWGASSFASGDVIYVDVSACSWYENDGCGPGIQLNKTGNYIKMDKVADKLYTYTFAQSVTSFNLGRVAATGTTKHNNFGGTFTNYEPSSKNVFKVNSGSTDGSWESPSFIKVYFDNSNTNWTNIYMCYGHSSYSKMNVKVNNQACGNIYYAIITDNWTDETQIAFHNSTQADTSWGSENGSIAHRYGWLNGDVTHTYDITLDNANGKVFKPSKSTSKLTTGNNGKQIDAHLWDGDDAYAEETFSQSMCCTAPTSAPTLSKVSDIVKCGTTTITSGTLEIVTVNTGSTYYYKIGTNGTEQEISLNNKQFTVSSEGDYYVKEVNDCGASSSWSTTEVTISEINNQVSISAITGSETICAGVTGQEYSIETIDGVSSYAWSVTGEGLSTNSSTSNSVLISAENKTSQVDGTLSVTVTKNGCPTSIQQPKSITLIPLPTITTVDPTSGKACSNTTIADLEAGLTITKSDNSDTKWYKGVEEKSSTATVETGEYTIKAISNIGSCVSNSSVTYNVTGITTIPTGLTIDINGKTSASICGGTATINAKATGATSYSLYKGNGDLVETINGDANGVSFTVSGANTYKVKATNNCGTTDYSSDVTLTVNPVPSFTTRPSSVTLCSSSTPISVAELIAETNASNNATIKLYDEKGVEIKGDIDINVNTQTTTTYQLKASTQTCSSDFEEFILTVNPLPAAPSLISPDPVCEGTTVDLPIGYNWYNAETDGTEVQNTAISVTGTYWAAAVQNECESATRTRYDVTVNPKPTISISGKETAVLYEDVTLTAEATAGATIKWYEDAVEKATGATYVVTSATETSKTVTAKAFLNGCESDEASHPVKFSAEDCGNIGSNNSIIITCDPGSYTGDLYCYIFGATTPNGWSNCKGTKTNGIWKWEFNNINEGDHSLIFHSNSKSDGKDCKTGDLNHQLQRGYQYDYALNGVNNNWCNEPHPTTIDPVSGKKLQTITAPAVKTVSVNSEQGSGVVNFTGQIIKTGCAATSNIYYGYQFKKADEEWPTTGVEASNTPVKGKLIPLTNASETALYYQFSANVENLEDGDYHFRAYIINGYDFTNGNYDQGVYYGLDKLVTVSTVQTPVTRASIELTESNGTPVANDKKYCVGETAYIMVESDVKYTDISWKSQQGVDIVQTRLMNMYQFVVKGNDNIVVLLSNKYNVTPAESNTIEVYTFADPVLPTVSLNKVSICSNDAVGATVKLTNVAKGQTYQLYQQIDNGDGTFTEQTIGSAKTQTEEVTDKTELVLHTLTNTAATGKYFVKTYTAQCAINLAATQPFTFTVVDAAEVFISLEPISAETTPWMPAKFTVSASDAYTLNVTKGNPAEAATEAEVSQNGNNVSVKIPLPEGATGGEGQYDNVSFPQDATTSYTVTAKLVSIGGEDNPCAVPATATITLTPYVEECTIGH